MPFAGIPPAAATQPAARAGTGGRSLAILIAEDNDINALLARALLTKLGHRPSVAANGAAALDAWQQARSMGAPYDLIFMDVHMPGMDGLEATRRIRAAEMQTDEPHTPIIALTANAFAEDRNACLDAGMDGLLVKPLDRDQMIVTLEKLQSRSLAA